jgi:hypothetical protein
MENNTSVDEQFKPVDMFDEMRDVAPDIEEFLFGSQSQLNTDMIASPYHKDADTSTDKIEKSVRTMAHLLLRMLS